MTGIDVPDLLPHLYQFIAELPRLGRDANGTILYAERVAWMTHKGFTREQCRVLHDLIDAAELGRAEALEESRAQRRR